MRRVRLIFDEAIIAAEGSSVQRTILAACPTARFRSNGTRPIRFKVAGATLGERPNVRLMVGANVRATIAFGRGGVEVERSPSLESTQIYLHSWATPNEGIGDSRLMSDRAIVDCVARAFGSAWLTVDLFSAVRAVIAVVATTLFGP